MKTYKPMSEAELQSYLAAIRKHPSNNRRKTPWVYIIGVTAIIVTIITYATS